MNVSNFPPSKLNNNLTFGFLLESLSKIGDVKSSIKPSYSLLHFIVSQLAKNNPSTLQWKSEISEVFQCKNMNPQKVMEDLLQLEKEIDKLQSCVEKLPKDFSENASKFLVLAKKQISQHLSSIEESEKAFTKCVSLFCEDSETTVSDFFMHIENFSSSFYSIVESIEKKRLEEEKKKERQEKVAEKKELLKTKKEERIKKKGLRKLF